ncbi:MAG: hypothetical protein AAFY29_05365 [Pseudomonadota bacterium]
MNQTVLAAVFSLVGLLCHGPAAAQDEDIAASMTRHRYKARVPVQPYTAAVVDYLADRALREHLEKQQDAAASSDAATDSQMKWLGFAWAPEEPIQHPKADRIRESICADPSPVTANEAELITKGEQFRSSIDTLTREEEEHWHRYYLRMNADEQEEIDRRIEVLPEFEERSYVRLDWVAAEAPRSFGRYLQEICIRWEQRR